MNRILPALCGILVLATGCATRGSVRQLQADLSAVRTEIATLRQLHDQTSHESARALGELKALETRLRDLNASVGEATAELARLKGQLAATEDALRKVQTELTARPTQVVAPPPPAPERPREVVTRPAAPEAAYNQALSTFHAREHGQAVLEFLDFIGKYPRHPLAANAQYWIGEAYYVQRDYRQGLVEFQKVLEYPASNGKAADALLKIGLCYASLREPAQARQRWQQVVKEYPGSAAATNARKLLAGRRTSAH